MVLAPGLGLYFIGTPVLQRFFACAGSLAIFDSRDMTSANTTQGLRRNEQRTEIINLTQMRDAPCCVGRAFSVLCLQCACDQQHHTLAEA
jgi:hypothetical protein